MDSVPGRDKHEQAFLDKVSAFTLKKMQWQFCHSDSAFADTPANIHQLDHVINAYLFSAFNTCCHHFQQQPVLQALKSPGYRYRLLQHLPATLLQSLRDPHLFVNRLVLDPAGLELAVQIANHSLFSKQHSWFNNAEELQKLEDVEYMALLCATVLFRQCLHKHSPAAEMQLFYQGVCSAFINLQFAREHKLNPLHGFLLPLIHFVSLILIWRELEQQQSLPDARQLLHEIDDMQLKLAYWIARDWGLPDEIAYSLKERFIVTEKPSLAASLMQKSELVYIAILLLQRGWLSRQQLQGFLKFMQLEHYHFLDNAGPAH